MQSVKKTRVKLFRLSFSTQSKKSSFSTGSASRKSQSEKVESKKPFFDCVRKPDFGFSRKRPFSTDKSDCIRNGPFLAQSDSASRKTALFDWTFFRLDYSGPSYRQSSRFYSFCLLYGARNSVGSSVIRALLASNACFTRDQPSSKRVGGVGLSRKPPKLRSWRCTQPRAAKATAGVAVVGKIASITRATAVV